LALLLTALCACTSPADFGHVVACVQHQRWL